MAPKKIPQTDHCAPNYPGVRNALPVHGSGEADIKSGNGTPGRSQLYINGELVGQLDLPVTIPLQNGLGQGIVCGRHVGAPVTNAYNPPFEFTGTIERVTVDVSGDLIHDTEAQIRMVMARQ